ncbi:stage II sporulation protein M [Pseudahrensia aquimaris]|uniref:Stage II sporulation protein M n=1 Tax=Pseudahrensia aquimaris TaxID=744461 RepID=A0ABW3FIS3_9HYPH
MSTEDLMRSARFRKEREQEWKRLSDLVTRVEKSGVQNLGFEDAERLTALYRQAMNSLSLAREISLDRALLTYLESLCARAYLAVYAPRDTLVGLVGRYFKSSAPQAVRRSWLAFLLAFIAMASGATLAYFLTLQDSSWYYSFVPGGLAGGRGPDATAEYLRGVIYDDTPPSLDQLTAFSTSLFAHNTQVSIFAFALGVMGGLPTAILTFYNGTILGTFFAIHAEKGLAFDLFGWLSIHGVTELTAIMMAAAGGFRLAGAILFPGNNTRSYALRLAGRDAIKLIILAAIMLIVAGILEGVFRQTVQDPWLRITIGWGAGALWLAWIVLCGREEINANERQAG